MLLYLTPLVMAALVALTNADDAPSIFSSGGTIYIQGASNIVLSNSSAANVSLADLTTLLNRVSALEATVALLLQALSPSSPPDDSDIVNVVDLQTNFNTLQSTFTTTTNTINSNIASLSSSSAAHGVSINKLVSALASTPANSENALFSIGALNQTVYTMTPLTTHNSYVTTVTSQMGTLAPLTTLLNMNTTIYQSIGLKTDLTTFNLVVSSLSSTNSVNNMVSVVNLNAQVLTHTATLTKVVAAASSVLPANENSLWSVTSVVANITALQTRATNDESTLSSHTSQFTSTQSTIATLATQSTVTALTTTMNNKFATYDTDTNLVPAPDFIGPQLSSWLLVPGLVVNTAWLQGQMVTAQRSIEDSTTGCYTGWGVSPYIPVDPRRSYEFSIWIKAGGYVGNRG